MADDGRVAAFYGLASLSESLPSEWDDSANIGDIVIDASEPPITESRPALIDEDCDRIPWGLLIHGLFQRCSGTID